MREKAFYDLAPAEMLPPPRENLRALDIGCGHGGYLKAMRLIGWDADGVEWDPVAADEARRVTGAIVTTGDFRYVDLPAESFELIWMHHVIEHLDDPIQGLERIRDLLTSTGKAVLVYPNPAALGARFFHQYWYPWEVPRHLVVPPVEALMDAARRIRLEAVEWRTSATLAPYNFAISRCTRDQLPFELLHLAPNVSDKLLGLLEHTLVLFGANVGEDVRIVFRKRS